MSEILDKLAPEIAAKVAQVTGMKTYENEFVLSQLGKLTEETGEAFGSYLRANGFARRRGTFDEHEEELADVVITAYVIAAAEEFDLNEAIERKLAKVMTRGWKDGEVLADRHQESYEAVPGPYCDTAAFVELLNAQRGGDKPQWWVEGGDD